MERFEARRVRLRTAASITLTVLAVVAVYAALVLPDELDDMTPSAFVRVPIEALVLVALALVLPPRARRATAIGFGLVLGVVLIVKVLNIGFVMILDRSFDPVIDWAYLAPGVGVLRDTEGTGTAVLAVVVAALAALAALVLLPLAAVRLTGLTVGHRRPSMITVAALAAAWTLAAVTGLQLADTKVASAGTAERVYDDVRQLRADLRDRSTFAVQIGTDPFAGTDPDRLLTALRGKDVLLVFVESYGRIALEDSAFSPEVVRVLDDGSRRLEDAGFSARSAFLTSPTFGAGSWLAHATLQSGLWVDSQQRYDQLMLRGRLTLSSAFERAGWRSVFAVPNVKNDWPEGEAFYGYDELVDANNIGYQGPRYGWSRMPDQYALSAFQRLVLDEPDRPDVMAEVDLTSSHHPWTPIPEMLPWDQLGDGTVYRGTRKESASEDELFSDPDAVRTAYGRSVVYSLEAVVSFLETHPDPDLVLVVLGDHQPHSYVTGPDPGHDVPISVIAQDPEVLDRIAGWRWQDGLRPDPDAPVWRMDSFRDRFLTAFGPS